LTSFTYAGEDLVSVSYHEPARDLLPKPVATGKKFVARAATPERGTSGGRSA